MKVGLHAGRLCELISSLLCSMELAQVEDLNQIDFDKNINKLMQLGKSSPDKEITALLIPLTLRAIYAIRSKKKVAHFKHFDPLKIDAKYINTAINWVIAQLLLIYCKTNPDDEALEFLELISKEEYKSVEKFGNEEIIFNNPNLTWKDKAIFLLGEDSTVRITRGEFETRLKSPHQSFLNLINRLKIQNLIHENNEGLRLTKWGIQELQQIRKKLAI